MPAEPSDEIRIHLADLLEKKNMSFAELCRIVGISEVNLGKLKNGRGLAIRFSTLAALCRALDCQPGDLLTYKPALKEGGPEWETLTSTP